MARNPHDPIPTLRERVRFALSCLPRSGWVLVDEEVYDQEAEDLDAGGDFEPIAPAARVECEVDPGDVAAVMSLRNADGTSRLVIATGTLGDGESSTNVVLSPARARAFAAAILNAADAADGTVPLFASGDA